MKNDTRRYFIELQPAAGPPVPRWQETELRRQQATRYIAAISEWLKKSSLNDKVATMAVTALGQVQITCETDVIDQLRDYDDMSIAVIRPGVAYNANIGRL
jgi:hypothetical protein